MTVPNIFEPKNSVPYGETFIYAGDVFDLKEHETPLVVMQHEGTRIIYAAIGNGRFVWRETYIPPKYENDPGPLAGWYRPAPAEVPYGMSDYFQQHLMAYARMACIAHGAAK